MAAVVAALVAAVVAAVVVVGNGNENKRKQAEAITRVQLIN